MKKKHLMKHIQTNNVFGKSDFAMIAVTIFWGLGTVVIKNVLGDSPDKMNVFVYNGLRLPIGAAILFIAAAFAGDKITIRKKHLPYFAMTAFFGLTNSIAFLFGIKLTSASNAAVIIGMLPLFILLFAFLMKIEKPTKPMIIGISIGFAGSFVLAFQGNSFSFSIGDLLVMVGCTLLGFFTVLSRRLLDHYSPLVVSAWFFILIAIYQSPIFIYYLPGQVWGAISASTWIYFTISIIGPMAIANAFFYYAIREIGPSRVGAYTFLTPAFTLLFAVLIRHEHIYLKHILGLVVIIIGVSITRVGQKKLTHESSE